MPLSRKPRGGRKGNLCEIAQLCCGNDTYRHYRQLAGEEMLGIDDLGCEPKEVLR